MNRCKYCGKPLTLTPEYDTCIECQGRIMREATMPQGGIATNSTQPSMNIYDEAIKEVKMFFNDEDWVHKSIMPKTIKALEHAKKEHELLEVYKGIDGGGSPEGLNKLYKLRDNLEKELEELK